MKLERLLEHIKINNLSGDPQCDITGVNIDSRRIAGGHLFIALRGTQTDGHAYIGKAIELGARAILCETLPDTLAEGVTYVVVDSTEDVVGQVATTFYGDPTSKVELVGVTGTNGKTTIATLLYKMFRHFGYKVGLLSTVCNYIDDEAIPTDHTTPDPITLNALLGRMADEGCKYVFMEVSSHSVAQKRIGGLRFAGGIFTNLTRDHLDYHKTFENYLKAKKAFFDGLPKSAFALTNADDRNGMVMVQNTRARVATYSLRSLCDFQGKVLEDGFEGMLMDINGTEVNVQFIGRFNASNLLAVYGAAVLLGKKPEELKLISCHLGNGSSLSAVKDGKCQDTSMGLSPLAGVPMGTRAGDIDTCVAQFIMNKYNMSADDCLTMLNKKSGVLALSDGVSSDFRDLDAAAEKGNEAAQLALDKFAYEVRKYIGAYAAALGGVDCIVFTAGVGENSSSMRASICDGLEYLGVKLDAEKNKLRGEEVIISTSDSKVTVWVIPTNEELMIAQDTAALTK